MSSLNKKTPLLSHFLNWEFHFSTNYNFTGEFHIYGNQLAGLANSEVENNEILVFPNPAENEFILPKSRHVEFFDFSGT